MELVCVAVGACCFCCLLELVVVVFPLVEFADFVVELVVVVEAYCRFAVVAVGAYHCFLASLLELVVFVTAGACFFSRRC